MIGQSVATAVWLGLPLAVVGSALTSLEPAGDGVAGSIPAGGTTKRLLRALSVSGDRSEAFKGRSDTMLLPWSQAGGDR
jgi:hypothetical protein